MVWWAWVLVAWTVAAVVAGLVLAASLAVAARRDRARRLVDDAVELQQPRDRTGGPPGRAEGPGRRSRPGPSSG
jgi:hypothetical protein